MIPVVVRSSEEMLKIVPNELREAAYALGVRKWRTILKVVIPTAISGIASGVTLAIARVIGETAPILVTAGFATSINCNVFGGWMASLPTFIYTQILQPHLARQPGPVVRAGLGRGAGADHPGDDPQPRRPADRQDLRPQDGPLSRSPSGPRPDARLQFIPSSEGTPCLSASTSRT